MNVNGFLMESTKRRYGIIVAIVVSSLTAGVMGTRTLAARTAGVADTATQFSGIVGNGCTGNSPSVHYDVFPRAVTSESQRSQGWIAAPRPFIPGLCSPTDSNIPQPYYYTYSGRGPIPFTAGWNVPLTFPAESCRVQFHIPFVRNPPAPFDPKVHYFIHDSLGLVASLTLDQKAAATNGKYHGWTKWTSYYTIQNVLAVSLNDDHVGSSKVPFLIVADLMRYQCSTAGGGVAGS